MIKGRQLESAIGLACIHYQRAGVADIKHNATPMGRNKDGSHYYRQKASCDFSGAIKNGSFAAEAKEVHGERFEIFNYKTGLKPHQRTALERAANLGAVSGVIVGYLGRLPWEIYFVPIVELVPFLDAPYRQSVTPEMCRAWGVVLPLGATAGGKPTVRFLDGAAHPRKQDALAAVEAERTAAVARTAQTSFIQSAPQICSTPAVHPLEDPADDWTDWSKPNPPKKRKPANPDPFAPDNLERFRKKHGIAAKNWSGK